MDPEDTARITLIAADQVIVSCSGEFDRTVARRLRLACITAVEHRSSVWVDLSGVTFIDAEAIVQLLHAHARASDLGVRLLIVPPPRPVMRPVESFGFCDALPFASDVRPRTCRAEQLSSAPRM